MAAGILFLLFVCAVSYSSGQWQRGLRPKSENGFEDLMNAVRPMTLRASKIDGDVIVTVKYSPKVTTVPFWSMDIAGQFDRTYTLGKLSRDGEEEVSSIEISAGAEVTNLNFHISSNIGEIVLELKYEAFKGQEEIEIPDIGIRPLVPPVYKPMSPELACTEQFIYVKFERDDSGVSLEYGRDVDFTFVYSSLYLSTEGSFRYHHFLEKNKDYYGMEIELEPDYIRNGSEVRAEYKMYRQLEDDVIKYVKSVSKIVHSVIRPPLPVHYVIFRDQMGVFQETPQTIVIPDDLEDWALSCAAFGVPKPKIEIFDSNGKVLSATEVTLSNGMTSHVIAPMRNIARDKLAGNYKCVARSGDATVEQIVSLKTRSTN